MILRGLRFPMVSHATHDQHPHTWDVVPRVVSSAQDAVGPDRRPFFAATQRALANCSLGNLGIIAMWSLGLQILPLLLGKAWAAMAHHGSKQPPSSAWKHRRRQSWAWSLANAAGAARNPINASSSIPSLTLPLFASHHQSLGPTLRAAQLLCHHASLRMGHRCNWAVKTLFFKSQCCPFQRVMCHMCA